MNLRKTDPEFIERFELFALEEVPNEKGQHLEEKTRYLVILAVLVGSQSLDTFRLMLPEALDAGLPPAEIKEMVYQATAYIGFGRMLPFLAAANEVFTERGVALPLESQATTTPENRLERGAQAQADIFGAEMLDFWKGGHINRWLAANCFGDYYTRTGLDYAQREIITFCFLTAQGGCEPQLTSHAAGNMRVGNGKDFLLRVISQCLPYIGYPRSLNAVSCVNRAAEQMEH